MEPIKGPCGWALPFHLQGLGISICKWARAPRPGSPGAALALESNSVATDLAPGGSLTGSPAAEALGPWQFPGGSLSPRLAAVSSVPHALPALPPPCSGLGPVFPLFGDSVSPADTQLSYLFPFRSFGSRPPPGSRMPLQTKVR